MTNADGATVSDRSDAEPSATPTPTRSGPLAALKELIRDRFLWDLAIVLVVFAPVRFALFPPKVWFSPPLRLAEAAYREPFILLQAMTRPAFAALVLTTAILGALHWVKHPRNPFLGRMNWDDFEVPHIRLMLMAIALPIAWKFTTYDENLWLGQAHIADRLILTALWVGLWFNPLCVPLFVGFGAVMASQFYYPECFHFTWADKAVNFYSLLLFWVVFVVSRVRSLKAYVFPFLFICLFAAFYFYPAVNKLRIGDSPWTWLFENQVHHLWLGAWLNGWLPNADGPAVAGFLHRVETLIQCMTMMIEVGIVVAVLNRWTATAAFAAAFGMHVGIFLSSGIFFWEWMVPEAVLIAMLAGPWGKAFGEMFASRVRFVAPFLIVGALTWCWPYFLGWFDTPYYNIYDVELVSEDGSAVQMNREYLDPFQLAMTQNRFSFADPAVEIPTTTYGSTGNLEMFRALGAAASIEELDAVRAEFGRSSYDAEKLAMFQEFLLTFLRSMNERGDNEVVPGLFESLHHQYSNAGVDPVPTDSPLALVRLYVRHAWWDGTTVRYLGEEVLFELEL